MANKMMMMMIDELSWFGSEVHPACKMEPLVCLQGSLMEQEWEEHGGRWSTANHSRLTWKTGEGEWIFRGFRKITIFMWAVSKCKSKVTRI